MRNRRDSEDAEMRHVMHIVVAIFITIFAFALVVDHNNKKADGMSEYKAYQEGYIKGLNDALTAYESMEMEDDGITFEEVIKNMK